jgi:hypothetical protein
MERLAAVSMWRHARASAAQALAQREQAAQLAWSQSRSSTDHFRQIGAPTQLTTEQRRDLLVSIWQQSSIQLAALAAANR